MADRVQRMLENQRKREEAMKAKEEERRKQEEEERKARQAAATPVVVSSAATARDKPIVFENNIRHLKKFYAPLPRVERGKPTLIGGDPLNKDRILYCIGNDVVIRSLSDPLVGELYVEHPRPTTVARLSPDGRYICSADQTGSVRVWHVETIREEIHKIQLEKRCLGGPIADMAWGPESKRIVVVGAGKEKMGECFDAMSGSSRGTLTGHSNTMTTVDYRPCKPHRLVSGAEDNNLCLYDGPPFKWTQQITEHSRYVNCVRFNSQGSLFCSSAQDKKLSIFDAETAEKKGELLGHKGGVYCCSWSEDGSQVLSASGDKTCKIWDVETQQCVVTFEMGKEVENQQLGCLWQGDYTISISLDGSITYLDPSNPRQHARVLRGHNKSVESVAVHRGANMLFSGSYDSVVTRWDCHTGDMDWVGGDGHKNSILSMEIQDDKLVTCSLDDTCRVTDCGGDFTGQSCVIGSKPYDLAVTSRGGVCASGTFEKEIVMMQNGNVVGRTSVTYTPLSLAFSPCCSELAVGGDDNKVHIYSVSGSTLGTEAHTLTNHRAPVTAVAYSDDGNFFASGDKTRYIKLWNAQDKSCLVDQRWVHHTAKITALAFSPNSTILASASLDTQVIFWDCNKKTFIKIMAAHHGGVNDIAWGDDDTLYSAGQDSTIRSWSPVPLS
eukprot:CAMPEP_0174260676 /NCGR_PEP_ID=MMETSP0439-20130205/10241_1 /TAXON_ID=0 /ORGANISM="Stereomyxa ramosa, Strain Chinc5" /LENGTH=666 /DNA_ID=CAMNT_0015344971 /DNA_START=29 /DNA_END=2029 /DNA_ORIENTATION=+